ncbi:hypothetical protein PybrP1_001100 [[Pythium] brassicae (nom. inval.)]|nr:hypothetical protein PybrP1_001100 [[Pythium] brassicae (nom. inval.)]
MAVQVAQPADVSAAAAAAATAATPGAYKEELLSPVSKLEAARKHAALEQQRRVEEAVSRMASAKAENAGKRKLLEEKLDAHAKVKVQRTAAKRSVVVTNASASATTTVVHAQQQDEQVATATLADASFASAKENKTVLVAQQSEATATTTATTTNTTTAASASYDATHELLRATRNKLHDLTKEEEEAAQLQEQEAKSGDADWAGPSTNYHLKQLGLVKKKIDIYAPVEQQQQELRRLRDRSQFAPHARVAPDEAAADHDSENDSDFTPGVETESEEDSDAESLPEVEAEETLELVKETAEHEKSLRRRQLTAKLPLAALLFCVLVMVLLAAVELSQQQLQFCAPESASAAEPSVCASFLQAREAVKTAVAGTAESLWEVAAAVRARFHSEL